MKSWIQELRKFVETPNPRFLCRDTGWPEPGPERWVASLSHELPGPATEPELKALREGGVPEDFIEFYSQHNGAVLYRDSIKNHAGFHATGIYLAPVSEWPLLGSYAQEWIDSLDAAERQELVPEWTEDAIVFGEAPNSGNYFILAMSGEKRGRIFYFDHDGFEFEEYAENLPQFFSKVTYRPAEQLHSLGCYVRYTDGVSDTQWIPEAYASGDQEL